jgi:hypothetical protein
VASRDGRQGPGSRLGLDRSERSPHPPAPTPLREAPRDLPHACGPNLSPKCAPNNRYSELLSDASLPSQSDFSNGRIPLRTAYMQDLSRSTGYLVMKLFVASVIIRIATANICGWWPTTGVERRRARIQGRFAQARAGQTRVLPKFIRKPRRSRILRPVHHWPDASKPRTRSCPARTVRLHWKHLSVAHGGTTCHGIQRAVEPSELQSVERRDSRSDRPSDSPRGGAGPRGAGW